MTDSLLHRLAALSAAESDHAQLVRWETARSVADGVASPPHDLDAVHRALTVLRLTERHLQEDVDLLIQHAAARRLADPAPVEAITKEVRGIAAAAEARHKAAVEELAAADRDMAAARDAGYRAKGAHEALMAACRDAEQLELQLVQRGCPHLTEERRKRELDAEEQRLRAEQQWIQDSALTREQQEAADAALAEADATLAEADATQALLEPLEPPAAPAAPPPPRSVDLRAAAAAMSGPAMSEEAVRRMFPSLADAPRDSRR